MNNINSFIKSNYALGVAGVSMGAGLGAMVSTIWISGASANVANIIAVATGAGMYWSGLGIAMLHIGEKDSPKRKVSPQPAHSDGTELKTIVNNRLSVTN